MMNAYIFRLFLISIGVVAVTACFAVLIWWVLSKKRRTMRDIIDNVNETIIMFDKHENPCYLNLSLDRIHTDEFLQSIERDIIRSGIIPEDFKMRSQIGLNVAYYEGEIKPYADKELVYAWRLRPITRNNRYFGKIIVFNDITSYVAIRKQLGIQNQQLREAFESQRSFVALEKSLGIEEERKRITDLINAIAQDYLRQLDESIQIIEQYAFGETAEDIAAYRSENERMMQITRNTIANVRSTVKSLHMKDTENV